MAETAEKEKTITADPNQIAYDQVHTIDHLVEVLDVYFAEKVKKYKWMPKEETYVVKKAGTAAAVIKLYERKDRRNIVIDPNDGKPLKPKTKLKVTYEEQVEDGFEYKPIAQSKVGRKLFVVAICRGDNGKLTIDMHENKLKNADMVFDEPVKFLIGDAENTKIEFSITKDKLEYVQEIVLRPKADDAMLALMEKIDKRPDKKAFIFFKAAVTETKDEVKFPDETHEFKNKNNDKFEVQVRQTCPVDPAYRSHFVLHCTAGNMSETSVRTHTALDTASPKRSKAHKYVMPDGKIIEVWPFTEKNVWATKIESKQGLKGQMFHVEINYGAPSVASAAQYQSVADLYIEASEIEDCWPIIVPHLEVDRGIPDGHNDPTDFDYNNFYQILKAKGVPIESIPHFEHDRYWGKPNYKVPFDTDKTSWPPVLKGDPHKK